MWILTGIVLLIVLCGSVLGLAAIPIKMHQRQRPAAVKGGNGNHKADKSAEERDPFDSLFDVYGA
ncbi:hypothetical protein [Paenibacillus sp. NPDC058177]|uniref:hypothetical protein n=1 Tax=Paenibacillus sp. NPDC058177 TaxID=3346369 RepID=UPI0036DA56D6